MSVRGMNAGISTLEMSLPGAAWAALARMLLAGECAPRGAAGEANCCCCGLRPLKGALHFVATVFLPHVCNMVRPCMPGQSRVPQLRWVSSIQALGLRQLKLFQLTRACERPQQQLHHAAVSALLARKRGPRLAIGSRRCRTADDLHYSLHTNLTYRRGRAHCQQCSHSPASCARRGRGCP
jgi:hypothetical protein